MSEEKLSGTCLCGDVTWEMTGPYKFFGMCQCSLCRKVTGSAFASNLFCGVDTFAWLSGEDNRIKYRMPEPKKFGNCVCKTCGSRVPMELSDGETMLMPLGSTMDDPGIKPTPVCTEDHTAWFTLLTESVSTGD